MRSTVTATAMRGFSTGAKQMNQGWVNSRFAPTSAVPVFPATVMPSSAAAVPVPSSTTRLIIALSCSAVSGFMTTACRSGWILSLTRPSFCTIRSVRRGFISRPPLPIAAATTAIWSGPARISPSSPPCPIATRPTSKPSST